MSENNRYDVIIIGAGPAGYVAAIRAAQLGLNTALVEKYPALGGTCLNVGCIPSKALLSSTELLMDIRDTAGLHGILIGENKKAGDSGYSFDLGVMMERKARVVEKLTSGVAQLMKHHKVDVYQGEATVPESTVVEVAPGQNGAGEKTKLTAESIVLATGSVPSELPFLPFDGRSIINSTHALALEEVPEELVVLGAGPIGLELGSVWNRLGSKVTVIELMDTILPGWDKQIASSLSRLLKKQGMKLDLSVKITGYSQSKGKITLSGTDKNGKEVSFAADKVLVAAGRKPYVPENIIKTLGLDRDEKGYINVSESFETSCKGVYAIGDCIPGPMLAHKAEEEGVAVAEVLAGRKRSVNYSAVPAVVYTAPEAASVGKTEEECRQEQTPYSKGVFQFRANGKALAEEKYEGFVKVLSREDDDRLLGVHILGEHAGSLISEAVTVLEFEGSAEDIARTIHAHPTLCEAVKEAGLGAFEQSIHGF
jgi:dihydrolipoamide dehydrogenase